MEHNLSKLPLNRVKFNLGDTKGYEPDILPENDVSEYYSVVPISFYIIGSHPGCLWIINRS